MLLEPGPGRVMIIDLDDFRDCQRGRLWLLLRFEGRIIGFSKVAFFRDVEFDSY